MLAVAEVRGHRSKWIGQGRAGRCPPGAMLLSFQPAFSPDMCTGLNQFGMPAVGVLMMCRCLGGKADDSDAELVRRLFDAVGKVGRMRPGLVGCGSVGWARVAWGLMHWLGATRWGGGVDGAEGAFLINAVGKVGWGVVAGDVNRCGAVAFCVLAASVGRWIGSMGLGATVNPPRCAKSFVSLCCMGLEATV